MSCHSQTAGDDVGYTPLEYARTHGLSLNYLAETPDPSHLSPIVDLAHKNVADDDSLPRFDFGVELSTVERLALPKDAARLLVSISKEESAEWIESTVSSILGCRGGKRPRVEEPLLRTDNGFDCKKFTCREGFELHLRDVKLPLERVNDENGEGVTWPPQYELLCDQLIEQTRAEKISVQKSALVFLQDVWNIAWTEDDEEGLRNTELKYKKTEALEPVTPPLSPREPPTEPYQPSNLSPGMEVPILSDPASLASDDLATIEAHIFAQDHPTPVRNLGKVCGIHHLETAEGEATKTVRLSDIYSPLASTDNPIPLLSTSRLTSENLKVEGPLTPPQPTYSLPKSVNFANFVEEMLLDLPDSEEGEFLKDKYFEEAFGDAGERANRKLQQERPIEADSMSRVEVPSLSFEPPQPPWQGLQKFVGNPAALLTNQKALIRDTVGDDLSTWPGVHNLLRNLRWVPFSSELAKVALEEDAFGDESTWKAFVRGPDENEIINSSQLAWKPPGLKILREGADDDDEDDDVGAGILVQDSSLDLAFLVKKRRMDLDEFAHVQQGNKVSDLRVRPAATTVKLVNSTTLKTNEFKSARTLFQEDCSNESTMTSLLGGAFSTGNSLDNYIELRGGKKQKLSDSSYFSTGGNAAAAKAFGPEKRPQQPTTSIARTTSKSPAPKRIPLPVPSFKVPVTPINVIVSSALLKHRTLIKHLKGQLPALEMVERDFTAHNTTDWLPGSVSRSPIASPMAAEADLIVSAKTGIIITTLQKVKQKPLPGQKKKAAIRERLEKASARYDKLVVLVSEGAAEEITDGLDETDCLALSEFVGFTLGLGPLIIAQFIAGGEETLAKWLAGAIVQNATIGASGLLEEETHWELFLRRAGLNAFAAQVVVEALKAPDGVDTNSPSKADQFGLSAFVEMPRERRMAMFSQSCGVKVLERVSAAIDATWE